MELREGYKQTEVGKIPEDWDVIAFGNIAFPCRERINPKTKGGGDFCIELEYINQDAGELNGATVTTTNSSLKTVFREGDVLFGKLRAYLRKYWYATTQGVCSTEIWVLKPANDEIDSEYIFQMVQTDSFIRIASEAYGTHMPRSDWGAVKDGLFPFPSTKTEQTAIANALSDADALIQSLTRLIAKKRQIKQGAMQTLLNPYENGRLKVGWVEKKLGEVADLATGSTPPTIDKANYGEKFLFVSPVDLGKGKWISHTEKKLSTKGFRLARKFPVNSILFTCIGSTIGKSGMTPVELTSNQQINAVLPNDNFSSEYLYYFLLLIAPIIQASASEQAVPIINKTQFGETKIYIPSNKMEQTRIANILSDMDADITALETKLTKTQQIKQGMMQNLLTGRIRLI